GRGAAAPNPALALPNFKDAKHFQNNPADAGTYDERPVNGDLFVPDRFATGDDAKRDIRANDVAQGMLGDCYWLSALATMAETNPDVIRNAIKDNGNGTYDVTFYDNNRIPFTITVDNKFPVKRRNGSTPFAAPGDVSKDNKRELWVMIMEKAWAKAKGSFGHSEGGFGAPAMEALSGKPSQWYALNAGNIPGKATGVLDFKVLEDAAKKGYAMTTGSLNKNAAQHNPYYQGPNPLVSSHEYYISAVDPVKKTITIQNPWGWHKHERVMTYAEFKAAFEDVGINPGSKK
ncbi:MAG: C2 family cysteine protease, partial [Acidobacteria bacterium]|nr:C2 family cysteine protease [Acidobacteriota bacterium]